MDFFGGKLYSDNTSKRADDGTLELALSAKLAVFEDSSMHDAFAEFSSALGAMSLVEGQKQLQQQIVDSSKFETKKGTIVMTDAIRLNVFRVVSCLQTKSSLLLEGPPGIGKTRVVELCCASSCQGLTTVDYL